MVNIYIHKHEQLFKTLVKISRNKMLRVPPITLYVHFENAVNFALSF